MIALSLMVALLVYIIAAILAVLLVEKITKSRIAKYLTIAVFVLIPTWDIIPGRIYFKHLCEKEAGTRVFKTVEAEKEVFISNGQPDEKKLGDRYVSSLNVDKGFSSLFHITKIDSSIHNKQTGEILGTAKDFAHYGGWVHANLAPQGPPMRCPQYPKHEVYALLWREVIQPSRAKEGN